jgi:Mrp family chromosome partitioning ATPase
VNFLANKENKDNKEENCTHDCSSCSSNCDSRDKESLIAKLNPLSSVKHCIGIVSGKGGVGKSLITSMAAVLTSRRDYKTAILDADVTGPSIPRIFGVKGSVTGSGEGMYPLKSTTGIEIMSVNLLLENETQPVIWRGPVIAGVVKQFWTDVIWGDIDYMYVDMPPGTGDIPLTVFQSIKLDGIIIVTTPQELVSMIVSKAVNMAQMMKIPVLGIVENMSYVPCPDCGKEIRIFGESKISEIAAELNLDVLARIPLDPKLSALCDKGMLELMENNYMDTAVSIIENRLK